MSDTDLLQKLEKMAKNGEDILQNFELIFYSQAGWKKDEGAEDDVIALYQPYVLPDKKDITGVKRVVCTYFHFLLVVKVGTTSDDDNHYKIKCKTNTLGKIMGLKLNIMVQLRKNVNQVTVYYKNYIDIIKTLIISYLKRSTFKKMKELTDSVKKLDKDSIIDPDQADFGLTAIIKEAFNDVKILYQEYVKKLLTFIRILWSFIFCLNPLLLDIIIGLYLSGAYSPSLLIKCRRIWNSCVYELDASYELILVEERRIQAETLVTANTLCEVQTETHKNVNKELLSKKVAEHVEIKKQVNENKVCSYVMENVNKNLKKNHILQLLSLNKKSKQAILIKDELTDKIKLM